jgi:hypothetical protein
MEEVNWEPMQQMMNSMAIQLGLISIQCAIAYFVVYLFLSFIKVPSGLSRFLAAISVLFVFYFSFKYDYIPTLVQKL